MYFDLQWVEILRERLTLNALSQNVSLGQYYQTVLHDNVTTSMKFFQLLVNH